MTTGNRAGAVYKPNALIIIYTYVDTYVDTYACCTRYNINQIKQYESRPANRKTLLCEILISSVTFMYARIRFSGSLDVPRIERL